MLISELVTHILELFLGKQTEAGISHIVHAELKWTSPLGNPSVNTQGHSQNNKLTKANALLLWNLLHLLLLAFINR